MKKQKDKKRVKLAEIVGHSTALVKRDRYHHYLSKSNGVIDVHRGRIYKLARLAGALNETIAELAKRLKVSNRTLGRWMVLDPKITRAYQCGLDAMIAQVEQAAIKRAVGYEVPKTSVVKTLDGNGRVTCVTKTTTSTHIPPDPGAFKYILSKRAKKRYPTAQAPEGTKVIINLDKDDESL